MEFTLKGARLNSLTEVKKRTTKFLKQLTEDQLQSAALISERAECIGRNADFFVAVKLQYQFSCRSIAFTVYGNNSITVSQCKWIAKLIFNYRSFLMLVNVVYIEVIEIVQTIKIRGTFL